MRFPLLALLAMTIPAAIPTPAAASAAAATDSADLARVQAHLRAVTTMTANFTQTDAAGKTLAGTLTMKQPGRIRFQYQPGVPLLIVGDGKALTMIDYKVAQVSRWPIGNSPLSVLIDPSRDVARYAHLLPSPQKDRILIEGRDPRHPEFGTITIGFARAASAPGGLMLAGWTVLDAQGNRTTTMLTDQRFGADIPNRMFLWRDPRPQNRGR